MTDQEIDKWVVIDFLYFCWTLPVALCVYLAVWWIENVRWKWLDNKLKMHELYGEQGLQARQQEAD